jgi:ribosomal protein S18 acetylase RimI-like enzyme
MQAKATAAEYSVRRANVEELEAAFRIVEEYYNAASVVARDSKEEFQRYYLGGRGGVWLASARDQVIGCIALRELAEMPHGGEIKRLYVQPAYRQHGIAKALLSALEQFAKNAGYDWLYLDSAPGMDTAVRFYQRNGYEPCPRYNNNPQANIYLRKQIS